MKYAIIMRGIPGSGKSTVAHDIKNAFRGQGLTSSVHSTDDLCMVNGEYKFEPELAGTRHALNLMHFKNSLEEGVSCVICDNTNVKRSFYESYIEAAEIAGYWPVIIEMPHPIPKEAADRNTHKVPLDVIEHMVSSWEPHGSLAGWPKREAAQLAEFLHASSKKIKAFHFLQGALLGAFACAFSVLVAWLING